MKSVLKLPQLGSKLLVFSIAAASALATQTNVSGVACGLLQSALPGKVSLPGSAQFAIDVSHFELSSSLNSTCSVNPTTVADVSTTLTIIGRDDIRAPFAVKSGGHATNQNFSSTTGVQIAMSSFTDLKYDPVSKTVKFGPGLTWDQVYAQLDQYQVTVAGGRVPGVGTGLALGGGYSWVTDQFGLSIDNFVELDVVLPNGTFVQVSNTSYPDLFFGLKGGINRFGIVTAFNMTAHPLGKIWGGVIVYNDTLVGDQLVQAIADFSLNNVDPKAQLAAAYVVVEGQALWQVIFFYGEGVLPAVYQPFLNISAMTTNVSVRSFPDMLSTINVVTTNSGGLSNMVPIVKYTVPIINEIKKQVNYAYQKAVNDKKSVLSVLLGIEPFLGAFDHSTPSAYPHPASRQVTPCNPWVTYSDENDFEYFRDLLWSYSNAIQAFAIQQGQSRANDIHYPNYALADTPLELLYGHNLGKLKHIRKVYDPKNIMGLAGGYNI